MTYQADGWTALGDPTRRAIFERLGHGSQSVGELARGLPVSRAVSQHLKMLKDAGLVSDRRAGNRRIYQLNPDGVGALRAWLDRFWTLSLQAFRQAAEQPSQGDLMTTQQIPGTSVRTSITVQAPIERAFEVFTEGIGTWWPPEHHILEAGLAEMVFEPRAGGSIYDRGVDGSECRWAQVLAFEPPSRVVFSWDIGPSWTIETDHSKTSEVEVRFTAEGPGRTHVELEHRNLDRHGDGWEAMRDAVGSPGGWNLERFATAAAAATAAAEA